MTKYRVTTTNGKTTSHRSYKKARERFDKLINKGIGRIALVEDDGISSIEIRLFDFRY